MSFRVAAKAIGGVSAFFLLPMLMLVTITSPNGLMSAISLGASFFAPLGAWLFLTARFAVLMASDSKIAAFVYAAMSFGFAIVFAWIIGSIPSTAFELGVVLENMSVSLPSLWLSFFFAVPASLLAGIFLSGLIERAHIHE